MAVTVATAAMVVRRHPATVGKPETAGTAGTAQDLATVDQVATAESGAARRTRSTTAELEATEVREATPKLAAPVPVVTAAQEGRVASRTPGRAEKAVTAVRVGTRPSTPAMVEAKALAATVSWTAMTELLGTTESNSAATEPRRAAVWKPWTL
ncbi:MAG: hypothetical protein K8S98_12680 [Planctomycetes bacterium]|nr:hypothetical protein [Planctomycetota bacterium]